MTFAIFNLSGNIPVSRDWFIIRVSGPETNRDIRFSNNVDISSCPELDFGFKL